MTLQWGSHSTDGAATQATIIIEDIENYPLHTDISVVTVFYGEHGNSSSGNNVMCSINNSVKNNYSNDSNYILEPQEQQQQCYKAVQCLFVQREGSFPLHPYPAWLTLNRFFLLPSILFQITQNRFLLKVISCHYNLFIS